MIINARDSVFVNGLDSAIASSAEARGANVAGVGNGGDIRITTGSLSLTDGGQLLAATFTQGNAGSVIITARDSVFIDGTDRTLPGFGSGIFTSVGGDPTVLSLGNGGDIRITTGSLLLTNGARLFAFTFGQGDAGNVIVVARDAFSVEGANRQGTPSTISTATLANAQGRGGDVNIAADSIRLANSAVVSAETENRFPGGTVTLNANSFEATRGGRVITATRGGGQAGNIVLNVVDRITLSGFNPDSTASGEAASGLYANTARNSSGPGGTVQITTRQLKVFDQAKIAVNSQGSGSAGNIDLTASQVQLANRASLTAETTAVNGGNITLRNVELLLLRNGSLISTTAGTDRAGGNGGNINMDAKFIVAVRSENSDIRANAFTGSGGNVRIITQGLFGIAPRLRDNPFTSDITASSERGVQGTVNITPPDVDPNRGLIELPVGVVDAANQITQTCPGVGARQNRSEFVVKGRGGLPSRSA